MTKLRCLGWEGYADGSFAAALRRDTGIEIEGENHLSDDLACRMTRATPDAWDVININTPFIRNVLHPNGVIRTLPDKFAAEIRSLSGPFARFVAPATDKNGDLIGIPQRCGPFNLVINQKRLSVDFVRECGFSLALDPYFRNRFGILSYEDFNVMHIAIAAGLNPFKTFDDAAVLIFAHVARTIFLSAHTISADHNLLNQALVDGEIDFYMSGGIYTASPVRLAGRLEVRAVTPDNGPIEGKGGVAFVEINALLNHNKNSFEVGEAYLDYLGSDTGAVAASLAANACNPVVQMSRKSALDRFNRQQLRAMQWDDFEEDMSRCAEYSIMPDYKRLSEILRTASMTEANGHHGGKRV
jgi:spermidine/putrescine transport system substrate-binding protein